MKAKVLLCGPTLYHDKALQRSLSKSFKLHLLANYHENELQKTIAVKKITLLVLEFSKVWQKEVEIIRGLVVQYISLSVIVINGNSSNEAIIKPFITGPRMHFVNPNSRELLVERIEALLQ